MKRGFTLIELLVSITILGIIALIAVPSIIPIVNIYTENVYKETVRNIKDATHLYVLKNSGDFSTVVGSKSLVTIRQLKDASLLKEKIYDPRTKKLIEDGEVLVTLESNGEYSYQYLNSHYEKEDLLVWYDGYNHGTNINLWEDLSTLNNDGVLSGFTFDSTGNWEDSHLMFDGLNDKVLIPSLGMRTNITYEMLIKMDNSTIITWTVGENTLIIYANGNAHIESDTGSVLVGTTFTIPTDVIKLLTVTYNIASGQARYYLDGVLVKSISLPTSSTNFSFSNGQYLFANYNSTSFGDGNIYSVRMYDKVLTEDTIKANYNIDKERFNF